MVVGDRVLEVPEEERPPREEFLGSARGGGGWGGVIGRGGGLGVEGVAWG